MIELAISLHLFWDNDLAQNKQQAIIFSEDGLIQWCIFASLGPNELIIRQVVARLHFWSQGSSRRVRALHSYRRDRINALAMELL